MYLRYVLLSLHSALRIVTQNVSCLGAVVLAPCRILRRKGITLKHISLYSDQFLVYLRQIALFNYLGYVANCGANL